MPAGCGRPLTSPAHRLERFDMGRRRRRHLLRRLRQSPTSPHVLDRIGQRPDTVLRPDVTRIRPGEGIDFARPHLKHRTRTLRPQYVDNPCRCLSADLAGENMDRYQVTRSAPLRPRRPSANGGPAHHSRRPSGEFSSENVHRVQVLPNSRAHCRRMLTPASASRVTGFPIGGCSLSVWVHPHHIMPGAHVKGSKALWADRPTKHCDLKNHPTGSTFSWTHPRRACGGTVRGQHHEDQLTSGGTPPKASSATMSRVGEPLPPLPRRRVRSTHRSVEYRQVRTVYPRSEQVSIGRAVRRRATECPRPPRVRRPTYRRRLPRLSRCGLRKALLLRTASGCTHDTTPIRGLIAGQISRSRDHGRESHRRADLLISASVVMVER